MSLSIKDSTGATKTLKSSTIGSDDAVHNIAYPTPATFGVDNGVVSGNQTSLSPVTDLPTSGQKIVLVEAIISVEDAMTITLKEESSNRVILKVFMDANMPFHFCPRSRCKLATADKRVMVQTSTPGNWSVAAFFFSEA